jgi:hypothetical protein
MEWKKIDGYNYSISKNGEVRNDKTNKILKPRLDTYIYYVCLFKNNKRKRIQLHRLLAIAFIPNPDNKPFVDHIDENRTNNKLENLRWSMRGRGTISEDMEWKKIDGYNYSISKNGEVRNDETNILKKIWLSRTGYYSLGLCKNSKDKKFKLHRLLALAFIPNPDDKPCVDHKDGNPKNNKLENLRWCTIQENTRNMKGHGKYKKGVSLITNSNKFASHIKINGKKKHLGCFETEDEAHEVYCEKAKEVFGEFFRKE